ASTFGSSVGPSAPQFHEWLSFVPSLLSSLLASLSFWSYDTRSCRVNPSWQVTKLMLAYGRRPVCSYRSPDPVIRLASLSAGTSCPAQYLRMASRYSPFHSVHPTGKFPTW